MWVITCRRHVQCRSLMILQLGKWAVAVAHNNVTVLYLCCNEAWVDSVHCLSKKYATCLIITLSNVDRFSKFFHQLICKKIGCVVCMHHKDFHLICNALLHYLVKFENPWHHMTDETAVKRGWLKTSVTYVVLLCFRFAEVWVWSHLEEGVVCVCSWTPTGPRWK